jgi:tetratricopeptide (TPR) repeat protein
MARSGILAITVSALLCAALGAARPASAQVTRAFPDCNSNLADTRPDPAVAACSDAVASGRFQGAALAEAYALRGEAYQTRGEQSRREADYLAAIADYTEAVRLNPAQGPAWNNRCLTRVELGRDLELAGPDCDQAVRLMATADPLDTRGVLHLARREWGAAVADFDAALARRPRLASSLYGRGIARIRLGQTADGRADLKAAADLDGSVTQLFVTYGITP